jgi:hypothetical protein
MERLLLTGGTLTAHSANTVTPSPLSPYAGTVIKIADNDKGVWVVGDARTNAAGNFSFSATVQLYTDETNIAGACAYASSYPPVSNWLDDTKITFNGTPMYIITLTPSGGGADEIVEAGSTFLLPCSYTMSSFTDATGAPGIINCKPPTGLSLTANPATICKDESTTLTASAGGAASYSINGNDWYPSPAFKVTPGSNASYTLYAKTEEGCVAAVADAAMVTVNPLPTNLTLTASPATICLGASTTLTAYATDGALYSLDGNDWKTTTTFNDSPVSPASYTLHVKTSAGCSTTKTDAATVMVYPAFSPGTITTASVTTDKGTDPNVTIDNITAASGGDGNITYQWRRTGDSNATLNGNAATYTIGTDVDDYSTAGTYYFNRYTHDGVCSTTWVAATGTYTLYVVGPPGTFSTTLCQQCCWDGDVVNPSASTWVDCHVTTYVYPFSGLAYTGVRWNGSTYSDHPTSDKDGRKNTAVLLSTGPENAARKCQNLGTGWYLPAYEELVNMGVGDDSGYPPLNNLSGANLLKLPNGVSNGCFWSSTGYYNNEGRFHYKTTDDTYLFYGIYFDYFGYPSYRTGGAEEYFTCAWRP